MDAQRSYKKRSRDVRAGARAHLAALRAARRAGETGRKTAKEVETPKPQPVETAERVFHPDAEMMAAAGLASGARAAAESGREPGISPDADEAPATGEDEATTAEPADTPEPAAQSAASGGAATRAAGGSAPISPEAALDAQGVAELEDAAGPGGAGPVADEMEASVGSAPVDQTQDAGPEDGAASVSSRIDGVDAAESREPPAIADPNSDLFQLPGAGSGLVWMLNQAGIGSLSDLAEANVAELESALGLIGQLLDVEAWVRVAREAQDGARPAGQGA